MRIAFVYDAVYPFVKGGAEKRVYEIGKRLSERGHEVHWYGIKWWVGEDVIERGGILLHGVCKPMPLYTKTGRRSIKEALWFSLKLLRPLSKEKFDLIDCQQFPYLPCFSTKLVSVMKKTPLIITWHEVWGDYWYQYLGWGGFFGKSIEKLCSKLTDKNMVVSETTRNLLVELGVRKENISVVPNGVDIKEIQEIEPSPEKFDVLFAGRLIKDKNVDVLIRSVNNTGIKTCIVGDGPGKRKLMKMADRNVTFLPFQRHSELLAYMKSSQVFVSPSTREGFGIAVLESLACGVPVITVNHPCNAALDLIEDGENGFVVGLSGEEIIEKIKLILGDEELRERMSKKAVDSARECGWDEIAEKINKEYENIANTS